MNRFKRLTATAALVVTMTTVSFVRAAPSPALTVRHMTPTEAQWAAAVYAQLNSERLAHLRVPLRLNRHLVKSAMYHDVRMARANTLSHQLPHEPSFTDREVAFGYHWSAAGENCGVNPDVSLRGVLQLESMMYHERPPGETGHRQNILSRSYRDVGVAVLIDDKNQRVWLTEDFGAPA